MNEETPMNEMPMNEEYADNRRDTDD